jgi:hypothetical protein
MGKKYTKLTQNYQMATTFIPDGRKMSFKIFQHFAIQGPTIRAFWYESMPSGNWQTRIRHAADSILTLYVT